MNKINYPTPIQCLYLSLAYFIVRGIQFISLQNYLPIAIPLIILTILLVGRLIKSAWIFRIGTIIWALFLILWASIRSFMGIALLFSPAVTESHIRDQFTLFNYLINVGIFVIGIYLFRIKASDSIWSKPY